MNYTKEEKGILAACVVLGLYVAYVIAWLLINW